MSWSRGSIRPVPAFTSPLCPAGAMAVWAGISQWSPERYVASTVSHSSAVRLQPHAAEFVDCAMVRALLASSSIFLQ